MKKLKLLIIVFLTVPAIFLSSCDRGEDIGDGNIITPSFTILKEYMIANELDINNILSGPGGTVKFVVGPPAEADLPAFLAKYYIMDIRNADAYNAGHIGGAKNVAFKDILTEAANADKQILVVCYSGQTACYATSLLRLYGYSDTRALKWGMSSWNEATAASWNKQIGSNPAEGNSNWTYSSPPANKIYSDPNLASLSQDGADILRKRVEIVVENGFKNVSNADVLAAPSNYFVNNYFSLIDYDDFGHISNALREKEELLLVGNGYQTMDPSAGTKIVSYCYTGQTSAVLSAWLNVIGYDAYSLLFGMNGLYHPNSAWDKANLNQWGVGSSPKSLPLVQ